MGFSVFWLVGMPADRGTLQHCFGESILQHAVCKQDQCIIMYT